MDGCKEPIIMRMHLLLATTHSITISFTVEIHENRFCLYPGLLEHSQSLYPAAATDEGLMGYNYGYK